ncbi:SDR family oxidoreductase [bacterium]|nr:SDR family oxidoreductase [bacterium]
MGNWLILGATSGIAIPLNRELAKRGNRLLLAARDQERLDIVKNDLHARFNVEVQTELFDALDHINHPAFIDRVEQEFGHLDGVVWAIGILGKQKQAEEDYKKAYAIIDANYLSAVSILEPIAEKFQKRKTGQIIAISSVAGDRGRATNYIYGSAKAGLSAYMQGLRQRLAKSGVHVMTVKPGVVDTKMIEGEETMPFIAKPDKVALEIMNGIQKRREVIYTPGLWRFIMISLRHIPEFLFKRLSF